MVEKFVSAYCALAKRIVNIPDIYNCHHDVLDFSGAKNYDKYNGYKTTSVLNFPIENDFGEVIAVIQLINCLENGEVVPFPLHFHDVLESFGSQVGIILKNLEYAQKNKEQLYSFVQVLTTAIDEMCPFNANHTNNMAKIAETFFTWLAKENKPLHFTQNEQEQIVMSIRLHDIGKITTPPEILNKENRLDARMENFERRIEKMIQSYQIGYYKEEFDSDYESEKIAELEEILSFVHKINTKIPLSPEEREKLETIKTATYRSVHGREEALLTIEEYESLSAKRGNLSDAQWHKMENHVTMTRKFLEQIKFSNTYKDVVQWASSHHEMLDGSGYPLKLKGNEIHKAVRLITIIDCYEAMTATDRPYKKRNPMSGQKCFDILRHRVKIGHLDGEILELFAESLGYT